MRCMDNNKGNDRRNAIKQITGYESKQSVGQPARKAVLQVIRKTIGQAIGHAIRHTIRKILGQIIRMSALTGTSVLILTILLVIMPAWHHAYAVDNNDYAGDNSSYADDNSIHADDSSGKKIRVGLYFNDAQKNLYNAVSSFEITAEKGLEIGFQEGDEFIVLVKTQDNSVLKISKGGFTENDGDTQQEFDKNSITVESSSIGIIGVFSTDGGIFQVRPDSMNNPYIFNLNGKNYRGILEIRRLESSDMTLVNVLPFEEYLYGVVPCEMGWKSHPEALNAQAVAARTYACSNLGKYSMLGFDLCNTVYSQVYRGYDVEEDTTNKAVDDTRGEMVYYNGALAQVYYFSSSGGRTEAAKNVWSYDVPYLQSVEDKYEAGNSPNYNWEKLLTGNGIRDAMASMGNDIGDICGINVPERSDAGRALEMVITGTKEEVILRKARCRDVLGFPSQWFDITTDADIMVLSGNNNNAAEKIQLAGKTIVTKEGTSIIGTGKNIHLLAAGGVKAGIPSSPETYSFIGRGYGHSVGMSQEGAKGMGEAGFNYKEILSHYFPGTYVDY